MNDATRAREQMTWFANRNRGAFVFDAELDDGAIAHLQQQLRIPESPQTDNVELARTCRARFSH
ncbi:hypothetical protein ERC79_01660 [Rhodococcus sp. ABRD24]|uniref:hypothetical protein n=1 Tax=Rhodococcus sp. ABRD24 TaxID=2507582 RepID=UPI00103BB341|nr:hypothetical protein [Rhodococcus sp. ABRD24]QBJ94814.1 hypothetical protein ERC79_01660 [Rhodococcus sp. ABRD24]